MRIITNKEGRIVKLRKGSSWGSELRIEQLSCDLSNAFANVPEVFSFDLSNTVCDAGDKSETIGDQESKSLGTKLPVLFVIVELSELTGDSVKVREIAVTKRDQLMTILPYA